MYMIHNEKILYILNFNRNRRSFNRKLMIIDK